MDDDTNSFLSPQRYVDNFYQHDLATIKTWPTPDSGPFGILCGWSIEDAKKNIEQNRFIYFGLTCYGLNLLNQAIFTHQPLAFKFWLKESPPFLDIRKCSHGHGGISSPRTLHVALFRMAENQAAFNEISRSYIAYFLTKFIESLWLMSDSCDEYLQNTHVDIVPIFSASKLIEQIATDPDCREVPIAFIQGVEYQLRESGAEMAITRERLETELNSANESHQIMFGAVRATTGLLVALETALRRYEYSKNDEDWQEVCKWRVALNSYLTQEKIQI